VRDQYDRDGQMRLNGAIELLEAGHKVFGPVHVPNGDINALRRWGDASCDLVIIDMEHSDFDLRMLHVSLQSLLNRRAIAEQGVRASPVPVVRVPQTGGDRADWIIKQVLDAGAYGVMVPYVETAQDVRHYIGASRYPATRGSSSTSGPTGRRGVFLGSAPRYWGVDRDEYARRAGVWPLDPDGELLLIISVESVIGTDELHAICSEPGVSVVNTGTGDLAANLGLIGQRKHPDVEEQVQRILSIALEHQKPCQILADSEAEARSRVAQGFRVVVYPEGKRLEDCS